MNEKAGKRLKLQILLMDVKYQLVEIEEAMLSMWREEDASNNPETGKVLSSGTWAEEGREEDEDWPPRT